MKKTIIISLIACLVFCIALVAQNYNVDISKIPNGTYLGVFTHGDGAREYTYKVAVTVRNGKMTNIVPVAMPNRAVIKKVEPIFANMVKANDINVDATTQASYKGVVHNALTTQTPYKK